MLACHADSQHINFKIRVNDLLNRILKPGIIKAWTERLLSFVPSYMKPIRKEATMKYHISPEYRSGYWEVIAGEHSRWALPVASFWFAEEAAAVSAVEVAKTFEADEDALKYLSEATCKDMPSRWSLKQ
jgi:hypothetical protein